MIQEKIGGLLKLEHINIKKLENERGDRRTRTGNGGIDPGFGRKRWIRSVYH
jgi:hypothetical protein